MSTKRDIWLRKYQNKLDLLKYPTKLPFQAKEYSNILLRYKRYHEISLSSVLWAKIHQMRCKIHINYFTLTSEISQLSIMEFKSNHSHVNYVQINK